ncbi:Uncharacterised protein g8611 [Pycnogonum litorale]
MTSYVKANKDVTIDLQVKSWNSTADEVKTSNNISNDVEATKIQRLLDPDNVFNNDIRQTTTSIANHRRRKRAVFNLGSMVSCATRCRPLKYAGYGCFCGYLGSGRVVDGIDRCCYHHDWCYGATSCTALLVYFMPYYWKCNSGRPYCVSKSPLGWKSRCGRQLCECDRRFAMCLQRYRCPRSKRICKSSKYSMIVNNILMLGKK